mmetsp:Transcript_58623/g.104604  ORF Transcript_58623/g.104604 Transcript_58623/m.104604 type:complete len:179 (-) Transcript_58623:714-1250(-)
MATISSQLVCRGCHTVLAYPLGAPSVRCPICETITQVCQIRISCTTCSTPLLLPMNTTLALCPCCTSVMSVPRHMLPTPPPMQSAPQAAKGPQKCIVYVENPPTKGPDGKMMESIAVGTKVILSELHNKSSSSSSAPGGSSSSAKPAGGSGSASGTGAGSGAGAASSDQPERSRPAPA